jgi:hypothetical protein
MIKRFLSKVWSKLKQWGREWVKNERVNIKKMFHGLLTILLSLLMIVLRLLWALFPVKHVLLAMVRESIYMRIMSLNLSMLFKVVK